jgi:hypothetical protein
VLYLRTIGTRVGPWDSGLRRVCTGLPESCGRPCARAALVCLAGVWHPSPREEGHATDDRQKETWAGVLFTVLLLGLLLNSCGDRPPAHPPEPLITVPADAEEIMTAAYGERWRTAVQHYAQDVARRTGRPFAPCTVVRRLVFQQAELYSSPSEVPCTSTTAGKKRRRAFGGTGRGAPAQIRRQWPTLPDHQISACPPLPLLDGLMLGAIVADKLL